MLNHIKIIIKMIIKLVDGQVLKVKFFYVTYIIQKGVVTLVHKHHNVLCCFMLFLTQSKQR